MRQLLTSQLLPLLLLVVRGTAYLQPAPPTWAPYSRSSVPQQAPTEPRTRTYTYLTHPLTTSPNQPPSRRATSNFIWQIIYFLVLTLHITSPQSAQIEFPDAPSRLLTVVNRCDRRTSRRKTGMVRHLHRWHVRRVDWRLLIFFAIAHELT
mmetsp:Transcript_56533/g.100740  ORF Transcript_56533/g.100740 Transcript_56533/m.100740 type:complete len:151 (-) Transcript_56533:6-458(-)